MSETENQKTQEALTSKLNNDIFNEFIEHHYEGGMIALGMSSFAKSKGVEYNSELKSLVKKHNANLSKPDANGADADANNDGNDETTETTEIDAVTTAENGKWMKVNELKSKDFTVYCNPLNQRKGIAYFKDKENRITFTTMEKLGLFYDLPRSKFIIV